MKNIYSRQAAHITWFLINQNHACQGASYSFKECNLWSTDLNCNLSWLPLAWCLLLRRHQLTVKDEMQTEAPSMGSVLQEMPCAPPLARLACPAIWGVPAAAESPSGAATPYLSSSGTPWVILAHGGAPGSSFHPPLFLQWGVAHEFDQRSSIMLLLSVWR